MGARPVPFRHLVKSLVFAIALAGSSGTAAAQDGDLSAAHAWAALDRGDAAKAAAIFRQALERSPTDATLHYGAGYAAFVLGRHDAAISALKRALEYDPRLVQAAVLLAYVAYASADLDLAIRSLEKAAALAPNDRRITQQLEAWRKESALHGGLTETPGVRFRVLFEGQTQQALGDRVARVLEAADGIGGETLNTYPSETLTVNRNSDRQFQDVTRAPAWAGGGYDGRIRLAVGGALKTPRALDRVVVHEFVHAAIASVAPRNIPAWVNEGLASVLDSQDRSWVRRVLRQSGSRIALEDLEDGFGDLDGPTALLAYAESAVAAEILCERLGPNLGPFLQMLGSGHTVDQALSTFNVPPDAFHAEWQRRIQ